MRNLETDEPDICNEKMHDEEIARSDLDLYLKRLGRRYKVRNPGGYEGKFLIYKLPGGEVNGETEIGRVEVEQEEIDKLQELEADLQVTAADLKAYLAKRKKECGVPFLSQLDLDLNWVKQGTEERLVPDSPLADAPNSITSQLESVDEE